MVLVADRPCRANMMRDVMREAGISGVIRRLSPGSDAIDCARQTGTYRDRNLPDLIVFDYAYPDKHRTQILKQIAFGSDKSSAPVILLTSPVSQWLLESGEVDGGDAVMFSPTALAAFVRKMALDRRAAFFKALRTLYQFGPILVRTPAAILNQDKREAVISA